MRKTFLPKVVIKTKKEHILRDEGGCFLSLNLVNIGPNVAQNCCAYIILDHPVDSEQFLNPNEAATDEHLPCYVQENPNFEVPRNTLITRDKRRDVQQIELCWTHHGNPYHKDLNPGVQTHIDICRYQLSPDKTKGEADRYRVKSGGLILNTPIVIYSWADVVESLKAENIVTETNGVCYISDMDKLIDMKEIR